MIKVNVKITNSIIDEINITGHANYEESGKDIVCAGVSASLITTVNAILEFDNKSIEYKEEKSFNLKNIKKDKITNTLLVNLINIFKQIENQYSENIKVKEEIL